MSQLSELPRKVFVRIYCKIFCDQFPDEDFTRGKEATGNEIYEFLVRELGYANDPDTDDTIPGDHAIWYLGSNEKFGILQVGELVSEWSFGESCWDRVFVFLHLLHTKGIFTEAQFSHLIDLTAEGSEAFDDMYQIPAYLKAKHSGQKWIKKQTDTKEAMKKMIRSVKVMFTKNGWQVLSK